MHVVAILNLLFVAAAAAVTAEQPQEVSNVQPMVPVVGPSAAEPAQAAPGQTGAQPSGASPTGPTGPQPVGVEHHQPHFPHQFYAPAGVMQVVGGDQQQQQAQAQAQAQQSAHQHHQQSAAARHYANTGPFPTANTEQYGQPESASIPPNYKPFGSWGLYIGGNPADGYYSSYYKALSNSVDKQQVGEGPKPVAFVGQAAGSNSMVRSSAVSPAAYPYNGVASYQDQVYPYGDYYTPADLNSGSRVSVGASQGAPASASMPTTYSAGGPSGAFPEAQFAGPHFTGAQFTGAQPQAPAVMYSYGGFDSYAAGTKRGGSKGESQRDSQAPLSPAAKGYQQQQQQQRVSSYATYQTPVYSHQQQAAGAPAGAYQTQGHQQAHQVVAYPVPVGSQLVGSQPGVEGAFQPFGVHAFTRYAVKPTVVTADQSAAYYPQGVHTSPMSQFPAYKQQAQAQQAQQQQFATGYQQPLGFYGYPLSALHYSQVAVGPSFGPAAPTGHPAGDAAAQAGPQPTQTAGAGPLGFVEAAHGGPMAAEPQVEAASSEKFEKAEKSDKTDKAESMVEAKSQQQAASSAASNTGTSGKQQQQPQKSA